MPAIFYQIWNYFVTDVNGPFCETVLCFIRQAQNTTTSHLSFFQSLSFWFFCALLQALYTKLVIYLATYCIVGGGQY